VAKPVASEELARRSDRAARLRALKDLPAWQELKVVCEERKELMGKQLMRNLLSGVEDPHREIDKYKMWCEAVELVLKQPDFALQKLDTALKSAQRTEGE